MSKQLRMSPKDMQAAMEHLSPYLRLVLPVQADFPSGKSGVTFGLVYRPDQETRKGHLNIRILDLDNPRAGYDVPYEEGKEHYRVPDSPDSADW